MSHLRRSVLPAFLLCLPALALPFGAARAADDNPPGLSAKDVDALVRDTLKKVINEGADMYNGQGKYTERDYLGCYHLYEGALITVRPLLNNRPELQKTIDDGLDNARSTPRMEMRAFVLRDVIDKVRDGVKADKTTVPPSVPEKTVKGKITKIDAGLFKYDWTVKDDAGKEMVVTVPDVLDTTVTIDGKDGKLKDVKVGFSVSVAAVASQGNLVYKVDAKSPAASPPPSVATVQGKVVGVDKNKLTVSVDDKEKVFTVPTEAKVTIDDENGKLADVKKDSTITVISRGDSVVSIDAKSPTPPPPPPAKEKTTTGKVIKAEKNKVTIKNDDESRDFTIPDDTRVTIDGKDGKAEDIKVDATATVTTKDGKITKVDVKSPGAPPPPPSAQTLWDRLGGEAGVAKVVDDFVNTAGKDPKVNFWRDPTFTPSKEQVAAVKKQLIDFVSSATAGPLKYTGKDMTEAHKGMKITDAEFDAAAADLKAALEKNGVKADDVKAVLAAVEGTRKDIVEVKAPEDKPKPDEKSGQTANLSGKVTYKGQALPGGVLTLTSADGKAFAADIDAEGKYQLKELKPGLYKVSVDTEGLKPKDKPKPPDDKTKPPDDKNPGKPGQAYVAIPAKFRDATTSGLTVTVEKGEHVFDLDLAD